MNTADNLFGNGGILARCQDDEVIRPCIGRRSFPRPAGRIVSGLLTRAGAIILMLDHDGDANMLDHTPASIHLNYMPGQSFPVPTSSPDWWCEHETVEHNDTGEISVKAFTDALQFSGSPLHISLQTIGGEENSLGVEHFWLAVIRHWASKNLLTPQYELDFLQHLVREKSTRHIALKKVFARTELPEAGFAADTAGLIECLRATHADMEAAGLFRQAISSNRETADDQCDSVGIRGALGL